MSNIIDSIKLSGVTYTIQGSGGGGNPTVELTQAQYDALVTAGTVQADTYYIITDAQAGDLTNYYTKSETNTLLGGKADTATTYTKTETDNAITAATATKQDTLVSGTNIKTINNESLLGSGNIDIQGGKAIEAGRGISITTGETADTVSFDLPIYKTVSGTDYSLVLNTSSEPSANTFKTKYNTYINCTSPYVDNLSGTKNLIMGEACSAMSYASDSFVGGYKSKIGDMRTFAFGSNSEALAGGAVAFGYDGQAFKPQVSKGYGSFACGGGTSANTAYSFATGYHNFTTRRSEFASGQYNNSVSASTTFGDSGNTLFSVGNGTADNARHNAFEIRQNGDIYIVSGGTDIKLQDKLGGGGGSSYTAGDGIDITNDVISVTGKVETSAITTSITSGSTDSQVPSAKAVYDALGSGGGSITIDPSLDSGSTNAVANSAITTAINSKVDISDNNVSAFSGVQLAIAKNTYYGDKNIRTIYIKSIGNTQYTDAVLCNVRFGNSNLSLRFSLNGSTSGDSSTNGKIITAYTIDDNRVTHSLTNGVITVTFNDPSYHLKDVSVLAKDITIYYTNGGYSSGQTADVLENTVYDVLTELGENLVNNNNNNIDTSNFVTTNTAQEITSAKTFLWSDNNNKPIIFKQTANNVKLGFIMKNSASTNNELATFEFRPDTYTDSSSVKHPLLYFGHYRNTNTANAGVAQTMVGFRQYDQKGSAAYHYLMPLPAEAKTPFSLTTSFKNYFAPLGFKNGSTMITTDNTGVADFSTVLGGLKLVKLSQAEYDALSPNYDSNTLYVIVN